MFAASKFVVARLSESFDRLVKQVGFSLLSDDILSLIFELAHDHQNSLLARRLSLVNRRFRNVVLRMPCLWAFISSRSGDRLIVAELLARSSSHALSVAVEPRRRDHGEADCPSNYFHILVLPSTDRLRSLTLHIDFAYEKRLDTSLFDELHSSHRSLAFPVLQVLEVTYDNFVSAQDTLPNTAHFYSKWTMPLLHTLRARNLIPVLPAPLLSQINSCLFELDYNTDLIEIYDDIDEEPMDHWDGRDILTFLSLLRNVEELKFVLHY